MSDLLDKIEELKELAEQEHEKVKKEAEEKARKEAELKQKEYEAKRKEEELIAKQKKAKEELEYFESGQSSLSASVYESYLKAGYKPTPKSMHPMVTDKNLLAYCKAWGETVDGKNIINKIASYYQEKAYSKLEHPCLVQVIGLASKYGMPKDQFNDLLGFATSPEVLDALITAGADVNQFPMKEMMHYYGLSIGWVKSSRVINRDYDTEEFSTPHYRIAREIENTIKKVIEYGFNQQEMAKMLSDGSYDAKLLNACLSNIEKEAKREREEKAFREEQAKLAEEGKEKGILSFEDRMKKLEDGSMSMYDKGDEEIVVPFSILKGKGGIVLKNTPENKELVEAYLSRHKIALKTSLHINQFVKNMKKNGIEAEVCSQKDLKERYGENVGEMTPGKLEVKVPQSKIQKFIKLNEGDIYQISSERPTLAKAPAGGIIFTKDGNFDEMPENMVVKEKATSVVLQTERDM